MQEVVAVVQVNPPGEEVTVYPVIALPPLDPGADQLTTEEALATVPETPVGAPGSSNQPDGAEQLLVELAGMYGVTR